MKNQFKIITALTFAALAYNVRDMRAMDSTKVDIKALIGVQTCLGGGSCSQTQTLNAIGSTFDVDPGAASFIDLGTVTSATNEKLQIPSKVGAKTLYKFTTQGGKTVYLGLEMKRTPRPGTRYFTYQTAEGRKLTAGKDFNIVELYRYNDAKNEWLRNNILYVETNQVLEPVSVTLSPDGSFTVNI